ncbi:RimJ/RimL family protein N-acetyltransferase [Anaerosolibacter carboniphilus]|uniref:RimJ/RimL family protein N-acetyltransferase n=1 Tax=Anaerosolibacter carboniphilus TaxID=1417629 RepID=A0A841KV94_9FIRM|nr:GNAT family N-acetyltransferase [Anaerosolibacter carboniphilus]MBB6217297.1 RimJ/RimL family protein N-acetyltransferase [Anaerosolibacter carboniphilus]
MAIIYSKEYIINERTVEIRSAIPSDAAQLIELNKKLAVETKYMVRELHEIDIDITNQENRIKDLNDHENGLLLVASVDGAIVGQLGILPEKFERMKHMAGFVIGIEKAYWGYGIAKLLMDEVTSWFRLSTLKRIELNVIEDNVRGIALYKKYGFQIEGKKIKDHHIGDGIYLNTLLMGKLLDE